MRDIIDLSGERYGNLTVVKRADDYISPKGKHIPRWICKCDCGNETVVTRSALKYSKTQTCGCLKTAENLEKLKFGKLTVIKRSEDYISPKGKKKPRWVCLCDCGTETVVTADALKNGLIKSCGCSRIHKK